MQKWALKLSAYQYKIQYRSTDKHANADCLSRLPLQVTKPIQKADEVRLINISQIESLPVSAHVRHATRSDSILSRVLEFTINGWPNQPISDSNKPYFNKRLEITVEEGCQLWGLLL